MIKNQVTFIYSFRNREVSRIKASVLSLIEHGAEADFLVVDYGSDEETARQLDNLKEEIPIRVLRMETQGLPWNKCRAINWGVKNLHSPWIATSDIDMVYDCNPLPYCLERANEKSLFIMQASFLEQDGKKENAIFGGKGHPGGFVFQHRSAFENAGGYDEELQYWGTEDWDWYYRLEKLNYHIEWLPEEYKFYHVWHPAENNSNKRPVTASFNTLSNHWYNRIFPVINHDWGKPITKEERKILKQMEKEKPTVIQIPSGAFHNHFELVYTHCERGGFLKLCLGDRVVRRKLDKWQKVKKFLISLIEPFGLSGNPMINNNFDQFYALLPVFKKIGLIDYYIEPSLDVVYLLIDKNSDSMCSW